MNDKILDFGHCLNPLGMPAAVKDALTSVLANPPAEPVDPQFTELRDIIAQRHGTDESCIAVSSSEDELIALLARTADVRRALLPVPCPPSYEWALRRAGIEIKKFQLHYKQKFRIPRGGLADSLKDCDMLLMGNPAWPSSALMAPAELLAELDRWIEKGGWLILDERAIDFTYGSVTNSLWSALRSEPRMALIRSFSNSLALTLCPLSYAVGGESWIGAARSRQFAPAVSPLAHFLIPALKELANFRGQTVECVTRLMPRLVGRLRRISGLKPLPHDANWVLCCLERDDWDAGALAAQLKKRGIVIHPCIDGRCFPLGLRVPIETDRFIKATREFLMPKNRTP
ncbi:MAG: aminotransferase class I/II-fold pyridoxal phosphate-dependent enzyme [Pyramidobacter sp.]|jgi:histidinol-phosphate/aromatic aminotransferase/cobyric acid decarboxylase-like protein